MKVSCSSKPALMGMRMGAPSCAVHGCWAMAAPVWKHPQYPPAEAQARAEPFPCDRPCACAHGTFIFCLLAGIGKDVHDFGDPPLSAHE